MTDFDDPEAKARSAFSSAFSSADPPRNFTLSVNDRIRALTIGAPAYATRKKNLEDLEAAHVRTLIVLHDTLVARGRDDVERSLHEKASMLDIAQLNSLTATHNRYYPIEANLPMNMRGDYLIYGRPWHPELPWTAARLVELALAKIAER